jgi:hypothetical protein
MVMVNMTLVGVLPVWAFCCPQTTVNESEPAFTVVGQGILPNHAVSKVSHTLSYFITTGLSQRGTRRKQGKSKSGEDPVHVVLFPAQRSWKVGHPF